MKIQQLFNELDVMSKNADPIFEESGMKNLYDRLDFGFFPLGSGILSERSKVDEAEIKENGIMVLGNDFGTLSYVEKNV
jgi:hypothetical protein